MTLKYAHNYVNEYKNHKRQLKTAKKTVAGAQYLTFSREITSQKLTKHIVKKKHEIQNR